MSRRNIVSYFWKNFFLKIILLKMKLIYFIALLACNSSDDNRADIIKQMVDEVSYLLQMN